MAPEVLGLHLLAAHSKGPTPGFVRIPGPNAAPGQDLAVPWGAWIKPILDMGADGVILPQVRAAGQNATLCCCDGRARHATALIHGLNTTKMETKKGQQRRVEWHGLWGIGTGPPGGRCARRPRSRGSWRIAGSRMAPTRAAGGVGASSAGTSTTAGLTRTNTWRRPTSSFSSV